LTAPHNPQRINRYLCGRIHKEKGKAMARPIKETPILFGEDARRFEERMKQVRRETPEEREQRLADYELALKMLELGERTKKKSV
jgi:hypothetical protein